MKRLIYLGIFAVILYIFSGSALAQSFEDSAGKKSIIPERDIKNSLSPTRPVRQDLNDTKLENARQTVNERIEKRIEALNQVTRKADANTVLSDTEKSEIKNDINTISLQLVELLTEVKNAKDIESLKKIHQTMLNFRIFAYYIPKIHLLALIDKLLALQERLEELSLSIQSVVDNQKAREKDTKQIQTSLDDMKMKLAEIKSILINSKTTLKTTTPLNYKDVFTQVRKDLSKVKNSFADVRHDIAKIRADIKNIRNVTGPTRTPTLTVKEKPATE